MAAKKTPAVPAGAALTIQVVSRAGKPVRDADVTLDSPARTAKTNASGFATLTVTSPEIDALDPAGQVTIRIKKRHAGPLPAAGKPIVPSAIVITAQIEKKKGFADATPGLVVKKDSSFLQQVLVNAGFNFGATTLGTPTRRLTPDEVQKELMVYELSGEAAIAPDYEYTFTHDTTNGEFDACDPTKCKLAMAADKRISFQANVVADVTFLYMSSDQPSSAKKDDKLPGQRFLRDKIGWAKTKVHDVNQRHAVGLVRLCKMLKADHGIVAIYTEGLSGDTSRADCHGYGLAVNFSGGATEMPTDAPQQIRLGTDFVVLFHWGRVPMWDGTTVAADPTNSASWTRQTNADFDDGTNYHTGTNAAGKAVALRYRLAPPPFQDPVPTLTPADADLAAQLATIAPHFVTAAGLFQAVFDFATAEYSDSNGTLGPLAAGKTDPPATPIDDPSGHFILHPNYGRPNAPGAKNGRQAHHDHLHFQLGPTNYSSPRTT